MQGKQPRLAVLLSGLSFSCRDGAPKALMKTVQSGTLSEFLRDQPHLLIELRAKTLDVLLPRDILVVDFLYLTVDFLLRGLFLSEFR